MKKMKKTILIITFSILSLSIYSQVANFLQPTMYPAGLGGTQNYLCKSGDLNGDGNKDFIVSYQNPNHFLVYLGTGTGTFNSPITHTLATLSSGFDLRDFTNDGILDIAISVGTYSDASTGTIQFWQGNGNGTFSLIGLKATGLTFESPHVYIVDLDQDGIQDFVAFRNYGSGVSFIKGNNTGSPATAITQTVNSIHVGSFHSRPFYDLDGDGDLDLVTHDGNYIYVAKQSSPGVWTGFNKYGPYAIGAGNQIRDYIVDYVDADGIADVAVEFNVAQNNQLYVFKGTGTSNTLDSLNRAKYNINNYGMMHFKDMNNDGKKDIISGSGYYSILYSNPTTQGVFKSYTDTLWAACIGGASATEDFNNDGKMDILTHGYRLYVNPGHYYTVLTNNGNNRYNSTHAFLSSGAWNIGSISAKPPLKDFEGDGDLDLINVCGDSVRLLKNYGNGVFSKITSDIYSQNPDACGYVDFNNDGLLDIVTLLGGNKGTTWLGTSSGTFAPNSTLTVIGGGTAWFATAADFNNDGNKDIAISEYISSTNSKTDLFLGNGNGTFAAPIIAATYTLGIGGYRSQAVDLNNDGLMDIIQKNTNGIITLMNTGANTFTVGTLLTGAAYPGGGASATFDMADLNVDGNMDMAYTGGTILHWAFGTGTGAFTAVSNYTYPVNTMYVTNVNDIELADMTGDGKPDFIFNTNVGEYLGYNVNVAGNPGAITYLDPFIGSKYLQTGDIDGNSSVDIVMLGYSISEHSIMKNMSFPGSVSSAAISGTMFCASQNSTVSCILNGAFNAGNVFTAFLSDASGNFASEVAIGSVSSTTATAIPVTFPLAANGTGYRIRVKSSNPVSVSANNGVNLTIVPSPTVSVLSPTTTICQGASITMTASGAGSYFWQPGNLSGSSVTVTPSSTIIYTVTGSVGSCSNTTTKTITVNPLPTLTLSSGSGSVCIGNALTLTVTGANTYTWNTTATTSTISVSPTVNTTYTVTGTSAAGCTNSSVKTITVNSLPTVSITGGSSPICPNQTIILTGTGAITYTWNTNLTNTNISVSPSVTSNYTVTGTNTNGCVNFSIKVVTVNPSPTVTANAASTVICNGSNTMLNAGGASSYTWQPGNLIGPSVSVSPTNNTTYTVTGSNGCTNSAMVSVSVNPLPVVTITANPTSICPGGSSTITATTASPLSYTWSTNANTSNITTSISGVYTATITDANGCKGNASFTLGTSSSLSLTASSSLPVFCSGNTATLSVTGATSYTWNTNANGNNIVVSPTTNTTYTVLGSNSFCTGTTAISIVVNPNPTITASGNPTNICSGSLVNLSSGGANSYTWSTGSNAANTTDNPTSTTVYTVTGSSSNGCKDVKTVTIGVFPNPTVTTVSNNSLLCVGQSATVTASGANTYTWNTSTTGSQVVINPTITTSYTVTGTNGNGCNNSSIFTQSVSTCSGLQGISLTMVEINIYPNPCSDIITIVTESCTEIPVLIFDCLGSLILSTEINSTKEIDFSKCANGIYFVHVGTHVSKIIKQ
jgi:hypothetical protein